MSNTALNLIAISIFLITLSTLLGPLFNLSPTIPAVATFAVLAAATFDSFAFQGKTRTLFLDWFARFSPQYRERILHHEAGHFLVASIFGVPVTGYTLSAWEAFGQGQPGMGGVSFDDAQLATQLEQGKITAQMLDRYCTIWMAGMAAENLVYNTVEGGADDRSKLTQVLTSVGFSGSGCDQKQRFCALQARTLLEENWSVYQDLVNVMRQRATVAECQNTITAIMLKS